VHLKQLVALLSGSTRCSAYKDGQVEAGDTGDGGAEGGPTEGSEGEAIDTGDAETGNGEVESGSVEAGGAKPSDGDGVGAYGQKETTIPQLEVLRTLPELGKGLRQVNNLPVGRKLFSCTESKRSTLA
jgi:hypothetical protein